MNVSFRRHWWWGWAFSLLATSATLGQGTRDTTTYRRLKTALDAVPAIDTHDHLWPFDRLPETGIILMRHRSHVWLDSVWMPTLSYATAKRALHEWLDVMPSNRIMWGADAQHGEGIYGATEMTRRCLAEVLAERVERGELREEHALAIGRQVLRDNALALFPQLKERLWKHKGITMKPPAPAVNNSPVR